MSAGCRAGEGGSWEPPLGEGTTHSPVLLVGAFIPHYRQSKGERGRVNMAC